MSGSLERHWRNLTLASTALYPLSLVFRAVVAARRAAYRASVLRMQRLPVPVIVVGNITVGGTGKTPLVIWLASFLTQHGMRPGVISRGYGASSRAPRAATPQSDPLTVGDEPLLIARRSTRPVWIGVDRVAAGRALLAAEPDCDVIVSDDGLQHYALGRDIEIAVIDATRGIGNGLMLPAGPLREPVSRLRTVDAVVVNGAAQSRSRAARTLAMRVEGREFHNLLDPAHVVGPAHFHRQRVHAVAGIGNPGRFFSHLESLGIAFEAHAFPDHHRYSAEDLRFPGAESILMTEKDAVKCAPFAAETHWALRVDAVPDPELGELVLRKLKKRP